MLFLTIVSLSIFYLEVDLFLLRLPVVWGWRRERGHRPPFGLEITFLLWMLQWKSRIVLAILDILMVALIGLVFRLEQILAIKVFGLINRIASSVNFLLCDFHVLLHIIFHLSQLCILIWVVHTFDRVINDELFRNISPQNENSIFLSHDKLSLPGPCLTWVRVHIRIKVVGSTGQPVKPESDQPFFEQEFKKLFIWLVYLLFRHIDLP